MMNDRFDGQVKSREVTSECGVTVVGDAGVWEGQATSIFGIRFVSYLDVDMLLRSSRFPSRLYHLLLIFYFGNNY